MILPGVDEPSFSIHSNDYEASNLRVNRFSISAEDRVAHGAMP
jgi:hypothetical protein